MLDGLLEKIMSRGYWRINFQPLGPVGEPLTLQACAELVERSSVSLRGWDYPHISKRNDERAGFAPAGKYWENWIEWGGYIEFWRMYRSTQFLHYRALWEDWDDEVQERRQPPGRVVATTRAVYQLTEIFEFAARMHKNGVFLDGALLKISLHNTRGRALWVSDPMRMPFSYPRTTEADAVSLERTLTAADLDMDSRDFSNGAVLEFFDNFGWNPAPGLVRADQDKLFARTW